MFRFVMSRIAIGSLMAAVPCASAFAHCFVGNRFFPATLNVDDPCVADELSLPTVAAFKNGDDPSALELDISVEFSKRITDNFGISFGKTWVKLRHPGDRSTQGFDNLETGFKYQFLTDASREFVMSASLDVDWGHTGSKAIGAEPFTTLTPTLFIGQGFGFMSDSVKSARPFAITVQVGYATPTKSTTFNADSGDVERNAQALVWGGSLQYSMPYLMSAVADLGLPDVANRLIPIVVWILATQTANFDGGTRTTGTINPGLLYAGDKYQLGLEAIIPVNRSTGESVGVMGQLHLYLDDMFPTTIGRPLSDTSSSRT